MILIIDNYDSFTYNLLQYIGEVSDSKRRMLVKRNDEIDLEEIEALNPQHIVLSPGPCTPNEAGISIDVVRRFAGSIPILGVCLGHQAIAQAFGAKIIRAKQIVHGKTSKVYHENRSLFEGLENGFTATRYHSLVVDQSQLPTCLRPLAWTDPEEESRKELMALEHREFPTTIGLQFHPESILTNPGKELLSRFLLLS